MGNTCTELDIQDNPSGARDILNTGTSSFSSEICHNLLDCCHDGGGASRDLPGRGARSASVGKATVEQILITGDNNLRPYRTILPKVWSPDMTTHVHGCGMASKEEHRYDRGYIVGLRSRADFGIATDQTHKLTSFFSSTPTKQDPQPCTCDEEGSSMPNLREVSGQFVVLQSFCSFSDVNTELAQKGEEPEDLRILKETFLYGERVLGGLSDDPNTAELHQNLLLKQLKDSRIVGVLDVDYPLKLSQSLLLSPGPSHIGKSSHIHAVIMGIDMYKSYPLRGCVSDARLIKKYLREDPGVPKDHIQLLLGSEEHTSPDDPMNPSRANIIHALLSLTANDEIKDGDIIIVYFAGHGSSYSSPDDVAIIYGVTETLCSIDRDTQNDDGEAIPDISDRELNAILSLIANSKRSRITVILDCCHGGGASRDLPGLGVRTSPQTTHTTLQDTLLAGEKNPKNHPGYRSILSKNWCPDMDCHVILTACKEFQLASEKRVEGKDGGYIGFFTESLVGVLQSGRITENTTYVDLISALSTSVYQTPGVYGTRKGMRIWSQD